MRLTDLAKAEVKKHVGAIHVDGKLTLLQRKLANVLLWNAYDNLLAQEKHRIRIKDIASIIGFDSNDRELLKEGLRGLAKTPLEWNLLHDDGEEEWGVAPMLSQAIIRGGYCSYAYAPDLREKFFNPEIYARINLGIQRKISSGYALTIYENCVRYRNVGSTGWIDLVVLKTLLGVEKSQYYKIFKHLNNKIIKPSITAINKTSDICLEVEFQREKRRISAIKFIVKENPQLSLFSQNIPDKKLLASESSENQLRDTMDRLKVFGISDEMAENCLKDYDVEYIQGNLEIVERDYKAGKVKNLPAYIVSALKADYRPKVTPIEVAEQEKKKTKKQAEQKRILEKQRLEQLRNEFEIKRLQDALGRMDSSERGAFEKRFQEAYEGDVVYRKWKGEGMDHPIIQSLFRAFASKELLKESTPEEEFKAFVNRQESGQKSIPA